MKKLWSIFCVLHVWLLYLLYLLLQIIRGQARWKITPTEIWAIRVPDTGLRTDINRGIDNTTRALDVDNDTRLNTNANMNTNAYRTNAADDDNDFNWSWLGLFGLLGLMGLRNRDRERT